MKKFFKYLFDGILSTLVIILITIIIWAFITLACVIVVGSTPVWIVVLSRLAAKAKSLKDMASSTLDELERILDDAK